MALAFAILIVPQVQAADSAEAFSRLQAHVTRQVQADKKTFVDAERCTEWFYRSLKEPPAPPAPERISLRPGVATSHPVPDELDCAQRYPGGLDEAREDFRKSQEALTISLTFYEYVLVADANDDDAYSTAELRDMMDGVSAPFNALNSPAGHADVLAVRFEALRRERQLDLLMEGMGALYDKGYRFTGRDQSEIKRISE